MIRTEWPWTADPQTCPALASCDRCGGEIYGEREAEEDDHGHVYCRECREALEDENSRVELAVELLEVVDGVLEKYLSEELCNVAHNEVAKRLGVA